MRHITTSRTPMSTKIVTSQSPISIQQHRGQCDCCNINRTLISSIQKTAIIDGTNVLSCCSDTMSTASVGDDFSSSGICLLPQQQERQQQHRKFGLLRRISATASNSKFSNSLVIPITATATSTSIISQPISTHERRYVVSTGLIFIFMMTFVSWTSFLSTSHSLQQIVLESRHPLSADHHQRVLVDDATELQRQAQTQQLLEQEQQQKQKYQKSKQQEEDEYNTDNDEFLQHRRISMSSYSTSYPFYHRYETTSESSSRYSNDEGQRRHIRIQNDGIYVTSRNSEEYDIDSKSNDNNNTGTTTIEAFHVLAFGAGSTWGEGLPVQQLLQHTTSDNTITNQRNVFGESTDDSKQSSTMNTNVEPNQEQQQLPYPNLLDTNAFNAAMPYHGSSDASLLSAACTETIVGNSHHNHNINVITIEVTSFDTSSSSASHAILVQRLRLRYPNAIIVLVHIPDPLLQYKLRIATITSSQPKRRTNNNNHDIPLRDWIRNPNLLVFGESVPAGRRMQQLRHSRTNSIQQKTKSVFEGWKFNKYSTYHRHLDKGSSNDEINNEIDNENDTNYMLQMYDELAKSMLNDTRGDWYFDENLSIDDSSSNTSTQRSHNNSHQVLKEMIQNDANVLLYTFPRPNATTSEEITNFFYLFDNIIPSSKQSSTTSNKVSMSTSTVLSSLGHQFVASELRKLVTNHRRSQISSDLLSSQTSDQQPLLMGTWGSGDDCHIWYDTGRFDIPYSDNAKQSNLWLSATSSSSSSSTVNFILSSLQQQQQNNDSNENWLHKHTLDFTKTGGSGTITIYNRFSTDRMLYLTYLTDDDHSYPRARVSINGIPSVQLEPFGDGKRVDERRLSSSSDYVDSNNISVLSSTQTKSKIKETDTSSVIIPTPRTSAVGYIPAGTNATLRIDILQKTTILPFRLIGASLLANEILDTSTGKNLIDIEFSLEREQ
jgi:hypothetical protein